MRSELLEDVQETVVVKEAKPQVKVKKPHLYKVILLNDNYTPMDFVVSVLQEFFFMEQDKAVAIMLAVHYQGKAICGIYTYDVAETKMSQVNSYARMQQHPLLCVIEPES